MKSFHTVPIHANVDFLLRQPVQIKLEQIFFALVGGVHNCIVVFLTVHFQFSGFVPVWALAVWAALRFVPASRALAFLFRCLIFLICMFGLLSFARRTSGIYLPLHLAQMM